MQLSDDSFVGARNFANKVWNASRFVLMNLQGHRNIDLPWDQRDLADRWIADRFRLAAAEADRFFDQFDPAQAARTLYAFFWNDFCDWYIELAKPRTQGTDGPSARAARQTLAEILDGILRALHPVMPFVTEELWQALNDTLGEKPAESLMIAVEKTVAGDAPASAEDRRAMDLIQGAVTGLRTIRSEMNVPPGKPIALVVNATGASAATRDTLTRFGGYLRHLAKIGEWKLVESGPCARPPQSASAVAADFEMYIPLEGLIDFGKEKERLEKEKAALEADLARLQERLENPDFISRAPADKVEEVRARMAESAAKRARVHGHLAELAS
jgi:valyl-tRNA synthetase